MAGHQKLTTANWEDHWSWSSYNNSCWRKLNVDHSIVVWHLKQIGKVIKPNKWVPRVPTQIKKIVEVSFCLLYTRMNHFSISLSNEKWIFIWQPVRPAQWLDQEEAPKHFPKPMLHQKRLWSLLGALLLVCSTTAFWITEKPLHLRSMLSKLMRCTKNFNTCSWHWSTERTQFFSMTMPDHMSHTNASKVLQIGLRSLASSSIFTWPLTNRLPLLQASWQLSAGKMLSQQAEGKKYFPRVHGIL